MNRKSLVNQLAVQVVVLLATVCGLASCVKLIPIKEDPSKRKLVLNSIVKGEQPLSVSVKASRLLTDKPDYDGYDPHAQVQLFVNGVLIPGDPTKTPLYTPHAGDKIQIVAHSNSLGKAEAETVVPQAIPLHNMEVKILPDSVVSIFRYDEEGNPYPVNEYFARTKITCWVKDVPNETNYYRLVVKRKELCLFDEGNRYEQVSILEINDPIFDRPSPPLPFLDESFSRFNLFHDRRFTTEAYPISFVDLVQYGQENNGQMTKEVHDVTYEVVLYHLTAELYKYYLSLEAENSSGDNPFAEKIQIFTNVQGGIGIVAAEIPSTKTYQRTL